MIKRDGSRYLGNLNRDSLEVHDLENEQKNCQIDLILYCKHFLPDSLDRAHAEGFNNCAYCIGESTE